MSGNKHQTSEFRSVRRARRGRLEYYGASADREYWASHWRQQRSSRGYEAIVREDLQQYEQPFARFLPREGHILEAGCGLGQIVLGLRLPGYDCEGIEWAKETVDAARSLSPELPVHVGDVTRLGVPDGYYAGQAYISLGVVQPRREGPEPFLTEAYRVLADGGVMLISVPWFNRLRQAKARLGSYGSSPSGQPFYQYAFKQEEMGRILRRAGFVVVTTFPYGVRAWLDSSSWVARNAAHMIMFVCRKLPSGR